MPALEHALSTVMDISYLILFLANLCLQSFSTFDGCFFDRKWVLDALFSIFSRLKFLLPHPAITMEDSSSPFQWTETSMTCPFYIFHLCNGSSFPHRSERLSSAVSYRPLLFSARKSRTIKLWLLKRHRTTPSGTEKPSSTYTRIQKSLTCKL